MESVPSPLLSRSKSAGRCHICISFLTFCHEAAYSMAIHIQGWVIECVYVSDLLCFPDRDSRGDLHHRRSDGGSQCVSTYGRA
jgi:hypothetical protein